MGSGDAKCRDCGGRLLGTDRGRCGNCRQATETPHERASYLVGGNLTTPEPPKGNLTVTSQPEEGNLTRTVVPDGPDKGERETKQQRWKRKNAEANKAIHRAGQQRRRAATSNEA